MVVGVWGSLASATQYKNAYNIVMVEDSSINIGSFWYMMQEMFKDHLLFFKSIYVLE